MRLASHGIDLASGDMAACYLIRRFAASVSGWLKYLCGLISYQMVGYLDVWLPKSVAGWLCSRLARLLVGWLFSAFVACSRPAKVVQVASRLRWLCSWLPIYVVGLVTNQNNYVASCQLAISSGWLLAGYVIWLAGCAILGLCCQLAMQLLSWLLIWLPTQLAAAGWLPGYGVKKLTSWVGQPVISCC